MRSQVGSSKREGVDSKPIYLADERKHNNTHRVNRIINLATWDELLKQFAEIDNFVTERQRQQITKLSNPLFRGHPNSEWKLKTTLERETETSYTLEQYHREYVIPAYACLSGFSEKQWLFNENEDCGYKSLRRKDKLPNYEFMGYLRHHGFPSPLLDWTSSPYVAAFFAFDSQSSSDKVAIFWYQGYTGATKIGEATEPKIITAGPWAAIHKRHFLQQSDYSICFHKQNDNDALLVSHESVFESNVAITNEQDLLMKITLPASLRKEALHKLNKMNINPYSIYHSEDSLVRTVGNRLFTL